MDLYRKEENVLTLNAVKAKWDANNPPSVPLTYKKSEFLVENPKHKTKTEILDELKKEARIKCGLTSLSAMYITKENDKMLPSLSYKQKPKFQTGGELKDSIKKLKMKNEGKIYQKNCKTHKDIVGRIKELEDAAFRIKEMQKDNPRFMDKIERFKQENLEHYSKTFGNIAIGVHGKELPKFSENDKEWWRHSRGYEECPAFINTKQLQQTRKGFDVSMILISPMV